ncbi:hypothetical protein BDY21DRAFT_339100 [Lineolata rhizophorae]|uniref:Uncharacterized protein n=1 Tax=Lineolata rhizophorae TaxID=578093 RepID=A0A6A6P4G2_9PEZI|nr:hypothetical protein BDY21DRAFT_339100 [Lineolata rhizophorae]
MPAGAARRLLEPLEICQVDGRTGIPQGRSGGMAPCLLRTGPDGRTAVISGGSCTLIRTDMYDQGSAGSAEGHLLSPSSQHIRTGRREMERFRKYRYFHLEDCSINFCRAPRSSQKWSRSTLRRCSRSLRYQRRLLSQRVRLAIPDKGFCRSDEPGQELISGIPFQSQG